MVSHFVAFILILAESSNLKTCFLNQLLHLLTKQIDIIVEDSKFLELIECS